GYRRGNLEGKAEGVLGRGRQCKGLLGSGGGGGEVGLIDVIENFPRVVGEERAVVVDVGGDRVKGDVEVVDRRERHLVGVRNSQLQYWETILMSRTYYFMQVGERRRGLGVG